MPDITNYDGQLEKMADLTGQIATGLSTVLGDKANADASNIGVNADTDNSEAWGDAIGGGTVAASNKKLVTGGTVKEALDKYAGFLGNVVSGTPMDFTLPQDGIYIIVTMHTSSINNSTLYIVNTTTNASFKIGGGNNVTITCSGTTLSVASNGYGCLVNYSFMG